MTASLILLPFLIHDDYEETEEFGKRRAEGLLFDLFVSSSLSRDIGWLFLYEHEAP